MRIQVLLFLAALVVFAVDALKVTARVDLKSVGLALLAAAFASAAF